MGNGPSHDSDIPPSFSPSERETLTSLFASFGEKPTIASIQCTLPLPKNLCTAFAHLCAYRSIPQSASKKTRFTTTIVNSSIFYRIRFCCLDCHGRRSTGSCNIGYHLFASDKGCSCRAASNGHRVWVDLLFSPRCTEKSRVIHALTTTGGVPALQLRKSHQRRHPFRHPADPIFKHPVIIRFSDLVFT